MSHYPVQRAGTHQKPLWDLTPTEIETWVRSLSPGAVNTGGMLFPKPPTSSSTESNDDKKSNKDAYQARLRLGNVLLANLMKGLCVASADTSNDGGSAAKKAKTLAGGVIVAQKGSGDVYNILDPSFSKNTNNAVNEGEGAILSRLTLGGLVNGLCGANGGCVDTVTCVPLSDLNGDTAAIDTNGQHTTDGKKAKGVDAVIESAGNFTLKELIRIGSGLHGSIAAR